MKGSTTISPWQVPFNTSPEQWQTAPDQTALDAVKKADFKKPLKKARKALASEITKLQASRSHSLLVIMQATDAAGKDSAIREVFSDVNVNAIRSVAFKRPTPLELRHDFLWRCYRKSPARGEVVIFNRSYYEEVTTVRVHPEYLNSQYPGDAPAELKNMESFWQQRFNAINALEQHLTNSRTIVIKFWFNLSAKEQLNRFQRRLDKPEKRWKFNLADLNERPYWDQYQLAYKQALSATSTTYAPWYAIPADNKNYARYQIAEIIRQTLQQKKLTWPPADVDLNACNAALEKFHQQSNS